MPIEERLDTLRSYMRSHSIDIYYVPALDPHQNEYVPKYWQRRTWISDFTGSAGDALVTLDHAYLWTDARYFLQAENQLSSHLYSLMKQSQQGVPDLDAWVLENAQDKVFAIDPKVVTYASKQKLQAALNQAGGKLHALEENLIDKAKEEHIDTGDAPLIIQPVEYTGQSTEDKLSEIRLAMKEEGAEALVLSQLDAIAWLYNIRGSDVQFNPLVISYAFVTQEKATLFVDLKKVSQEDKEILLSQGIDVQPYDDFADEVSKFKGTVWLDPNSTSWWVHQQFEGRCDFVLKISPILFRKAKKNKVEQKGAYVAHEKDAVSVIKFLHWLENNWSSDLCEYSAAQKLYEFRQQNKDFKGSSFNTISGFGSNGAIVHYAVKEETSKKIDDTSLFLLDSGAQYYDGTTDITRTMHFGRPTQDHKKYYTLVLKGHIALAKAVFLQGTSGMHLDILARQFLWQDCVNYGHGTGHGVGSYLCVHEGPQVISPAVRNVPLSPGMIVSNEPGFYLDNQYGIRIENLCLVVDKCNPKDSLTGHGPFYGFDNLTLVPYAQNLIEQSLLTQTERDWVNAYHKRVWETISPKLNGEVLAWLKTNTAEI